MVCVVSWREKKEWLRLCWKKGSGSGRLKDGPRDEAVRRGAETSQRRG